MTASQEVFDCITQLTEPQTMADGLCRIALRQTHCRGVGLYLFNRLENCFERISFEGADSFSERLPAPPSDRSFSIISRQHKFLYGFFLTEGTTHQKPELDVLATALPVLFERKFCADMFERVAHPIDYVSDSDNFIARLSSLAAASSQMPAGAYRKVDENGNLKTLFWWKKWGNDSFTESDWDINKNSIPLSFQECIDQKKVQLLTEDDLAGEFFSQKIQEGVKSAILCPVIVGSSTIGVLSFAMPQAYEFLPVEQSAFLSLANSVGVSLTNFNNSASAAIELVNSVRIAQALNAVEIAQAARHSAKADLNTVALELATIARLSKKDQIDFVVQKCERSIENCFKSLDSIKTAVRPPKKNMAKVSLKGLFERAQTQLRGRIVHQNITVQWTDNDAEIDCYPDHLAHVFLNLMLNSVDAYSELKRQSQRWINCRIHDLQENAETLKIRFEDNAGGVDVSKLRQVTDDYVSSVEELVFKKDVTTKGLEGSGYGLFVSRNVVRDHKGDITLLEYKNKVLFELELRKRLK